MTHDPTRAFEDATSPATPPPTGARETVDFVANTPADGSRGRLVVGTSVGEYELLELLGAGGMAEVYRARHALLGRECALKVVRRDPPPTEAALTRFGREMGVIGSLERHPNVVSAEYAGTHEGMPYLVMELVPGRDLDRVLADRGPFGIADACEAVRQAAVGLGHVHQRRIVHRDLKPSNLILTPAGVVKILDLGIARLAGGDSCDGLTRVGSAIGTPDYMAPEQAEDAPDVDVRADLYSLGGTLFALLAGRPPFAEYPTGHAKIGAALFQPAPDVRDRRPTVPPELAALVARLLDKDPAARVQTPAELAAMLEPWCGGADLARLIDPSAPANPRAGSVSHDTAPMTNPPDAPGPFAPERRRTNVPLAFAGAGAALAVAVALSWPRPSDPPPEPPTPAAVAPAPARLDPRLTVGRHSLGRFFGIVGADIYGLTFGDQIRFRVELGEQGHLTLIGLNPDGKVQVLMPGGPIEGSSIGSAFDLPQLGDGLTLDDNPAGGWQAFAALASRAPLPEASRRALDETPWAVEPVAADAEEVLTIAIGVQRFARAGQVRGQVGELQGVGGRTARAYRHLAKLEGVDGVTLVAFPVRPRRP